MKYNNRQDDPAEIHTPDEPGVGTAPNWERVEYISTPGAGAKTEVWHRETLAEGIAEMMGPID